MRVEHHTNWQFFLQAGLRLVVQTYDNLMELSPDYRWVEFQLPDRCKGSCGGMWTRLIAENLSLCHLVFTILREHSPCFNAF